MVEKSRELQGPMKPRKTFELSFVLKVAITLVVTVAWTIILVLINKIKSIFKNEKEIKGKVVLITGTGRGMGRDIAMRLARKGAILACVDINEKGNQETVAMIRAEGGKAQGYTVNIAKSEQVRKLATDVREDLGPVDILVNNAALILGLPFDKCTDEDIKVNYEVNCSGTAYMVKYFIGDMKRRNQGHIVTISSISALIPVTFLSLYSSTKTAVWRLMDSIREEVEIENFNSNIKFTTVFPIFTNTSADYMKMLDDRIAYLEQDDVVKEILNAILYEKENVVLPWHSAILIFFVRLMPRIMKKTIMHNLNLNHNMVPRETWKELPYGQILANTLTKEKA